MSRARLFAALLGMLCSLFVAVPAAHARSGLMIGMTPDPTEYSRMYAMYGNAPDVVRVFSSSNPPPWTDSRIQTLKQHGQVPFISWKNYSPSTLDAWLRAMPADIPQVILTNHHEPEADMAASTFKAQQVGNWNVIQALPAGIRNRVKYGAVLTRQWTENNGRSYSEYDPNIGDFLGNDMYVNSWGADYPTPNAFMNQWAGYNTCRPTCRPKYIPELGAISLQNDPTDSKRAAFITGVMTIIENSWDYRLVMWWDDQGTSGGATGCTGTQRNFRLNERYCNGVTTQVTPSVNAWKLHMGRNTR